MNMEATLNVRFDEPDPYLLRLRCDYSALCFELAMLGLELAIKYDENQPRVPAGNPSGGQWTSGGGGHSAPDGESGRWTPETLPDPPRNAAPADEPDTTWRTVAESRHPDGTVAKRIVADGSVVIGSEFPLPGAGFDVRHTVQAADGTIRSFETSGAVQTIYDENGQAISRSVWTRNGPEAVDAVHLADFAPRPAPPGSSRLRRTVELGASLFTYLSGNSGRNGQAVMGFVARGYRESEGPTVDLAFVGMVSRNEVDAACPRFGEVQSRLDEASAAVKLIGQRMTPATYGTAVHVSLKNADRQSRR